MSLQGQEIRRGNDDDNVNNIKNDNNGNNGRGKGPTAYGKGGAKRHKKKLTASINGITKPAVRRLSRRAGIKRISGTLYEETRSHLKTFLESVIRDSTVYTEHAKRKTVTVNDVVYGLKNNKMKLYL